MKLDVCVMFLLLICRLSVDCSLPDFTPTGQVEAVEDLTPPPPLSRLPGLCRRLKRRRVTVLCNLEKFCWRGRSQEVRSGQVCACPRGSRCSRFFVHSL